jgi:hypothetical protein
MYSSGTRQQSSGDQQQVSNALNSGSNLWVGAEIGIAKRNMNYEFYGTK